MCITIICGSSDALSTLPGPEGEESGLRALPASGQMFLAAAAAVAVVWRRVFGFSISTITGSNRGLTLQRVGVTLILSWVNSRAVKNTVVVVLLVIVVLVQV